MLLKMWDLLTHALLDAKTWRFRACALSPLITVGLTISLCCEASTPAYSEWYPNGPGGMPVDAIVGAGPLVGEVLPEAQYLCRAHYGYTLQPGFAVANGSVCTFSYGGVALTSAEFDWYVPAWEPAIGQPMPPNAIALGTESIGSGSYLYSCLVGQTPGKYSLDFGACYYPYGGLEVHQQAPGFSWLVDPGGNAIPRGDLSGANDGPAEVSENLGPYSLQPVFNYRPFGMIAGLDTDGTPLYFCVAYFEGGLHPGKAREDWQACDVSWGGSEHFVGVFDADNIPGNFYLLWANYVPIPPNSNSVPVGYDSDGSTLFSCAVGVYGSDGYQTGTTLGKTKLAWGSACSYPLNGLENFSTDGGDGVGVALVLTDGVPP